MQLAFSSKKIFVLIVVVFCLAFAISQIYFNMHSLITPDELWVAHSVYNKYRIAVPYRDFIPYKTIIGYYIFLMPLLFTQNPVYGLIAIKMLLTGINTFFLLLCSLWFSRFFSYRAILVSLALLLATVFFTEYAADIRVDLMAYWCCLVCVLFLLDKKFIYAGLMLGFAFCISQKAIWYGFAANLALSVVWLSLQRTRKDLLAIIWFNLSFISILALYIGIFASVSNIHTVIDSVFYQAARVYNINIYQDSMRMMLRSIIEWNLFYLVVWPLSLVTLIVRTSPAALSRRIFILTFAWVMMIFLMLYKQPFNYYTVAVLPPLFLLYTDFFSWLNDFRQPYALRINGRWLLYIFIICTLYLGIIKIEITRVPTALEWWCMLLLLALPACIYLQIRFRGQWHKISLLGIYGIVIAAGIVVPLLSTTEEYFYKGYVYQQLAMRVVNQLTQDNSTYVGGVDLLYNKSQAISGNSFLEQNVDYLNHPTPALKQIMLPALDLNPDTSIEKLIAAIEQQPVKVFVHFPFMDDVPRLLQYLKSQFAYYWGNIYIYGPEIKKGSKRIRIKFSGHYRLESAAPVLLDGKKIMPLASVYLTAKNYQSQAQENYRLVLQPTGVENLPTKYYAALPQRLVVECKMLYLNHHQICVYGVNMNRYSASYKHA